MAKRLDSATEWDGGYRVIDAQPVAPSPAGEAWRPAAGELFKLSLGASFSFFLAALLIAWAGGADFADAFRMAAKWGGLSLGIL